MHAYACIWPVAGLHAFIVVRGAWPPVLCIWPVAGLHAFIVVRGAWPPVLFNCLVQLFVYERLSHIEFKFLQLAVLL